MVLQQTTMFHEVDRVTLNKTQVLESGYGCRTMVIRSGGTEFKIHLFARDPKNLNVIVED